MVYNKTGYGNVSIEWFIDKWIYMAECVRVTQAMLDHEANGGDVIDWLESNGFVLVNDE